MITVYWDVVQGSEKWDRLREGKYTGSNAYKLLKYGAIDYSLTETSTFKGNYWTKRGHQLEDEAIELYEKIKKCKVPRPGFVTNDEFPNCGYSPDGFPEIPLIESKAFKEEKHLRLFYGDIPLEVLAQVHFGMLMGAKLLTHLLLYNPDLKDAMGEFDAKRSFKIIEIPYNPKIGNNFKRILSGAKQTCVTA